MTGHHPFEVKHGKLCVGKKCFRK